MSSKLQHQVSSSSFRLPSSKLIQIIAHLWSGVQQVDHSPRTALLTLRAWNICRRLCRLAFSPGWHAGHVHPSIQRQEHLHDDRAHHLQQLVSTHLDAQAQFMLRLIQLSHDSNQQLLLQWLSQQACHARSMLHIYVRKCRNLEECTQLRKPA